MEMQGSKEKTSQTNSSRMEAGAQSHRMELLGESTTIKQRQSCTIHETENVLGACCLADKQRQDGRGYGSLDVE
jgi:hypothetical protein